MSKFLTDLATLHRKIVQAEFCSVASNLLRDVSQEESQFECKVRIRVGVRTFVRVYSSFSFSNSLIHTQVDHVDHVQDLSEVTKRTYPRQNQLECECQNDTSQERRRIVQECDF